MALTQTAMFPSPYQVFVVLKPKQTLTRASTYKTDLFVISYVTAFEGRDTTHNWKMLLYVVLKRRDMHRILPFNLLY